MENEILELYESLTDSEKWEVYYFIQELKKESR